MPNFRSAAIAVCVFSTVLTAVAGTQPSASASQYPAHADRDGTSIGARLLTPDQVQREIGTDLKRCCLVIEIAIYPSKSKPAAILPEEFSLRIVGPDKTIKPVSSRLVASILHNGDQSPRDANTHGSVGVAYESASARDPYGNREKMSAVTTNAQVAIGGAGSPPVPVPNPDDDNRMAMELALSSKSLPEGSTTVPVAGYLYFPLSTRKQKNKAGYQLENTLTGQKMTLTLSPP